MILNIFNEIIISDRLVPNYDENNTRYSEIGLVNASTFEDCKEKCRQDNNCVRFIYYAERTNVYGDTVPQKSCFIRRKVDIFNGRLLPNTAEAYSIKSLLGFFSK